MSANGSTAMDFCGATVGVATAVACGVTTLGEPSACTTCEPVAKRSAGSFANALDTTASSSAVTSERVARTEGTGSVNRFMISA